jgi:hypothetical protein
LTQSSLAINEPATTTTPTASLSDPDQATFTPSPVTTLTVGAQPTLPADLPTIIYPSEKIVNSKDDVVGLTAITLLFDQGLNWPWVARNDVSAGQIFAFMPQAISTALQIPSSQVKGWALKPNIPAQYTSTADADMLGTTYITYIPQDRVNDLAAQIKAKQSAFYTGSNGVAAQLVAYIVPSFTIDATSPPLGDGGSSNNGGSAGDASSNSGSDHSRQDAIIGVVSALGGIALLVLVFLLYRAWQRKREMAHRRMSDPPEGMYDGVRPEGREFDQDSVGGNRRRSFYFAEDSLRGYQGQDQQYQQQAYQDQEYSYTNNANGMTQRRVVGLGTPISAPMLRENTMNW